MAFTHGKDAYFSIDDSGGTLRNISPYVTQVSGLPGDRSLGSTTAFGDQGERFIPGLASASFTVSGHWDDTATTGSHTVLTGLRTATATSSFEYGPEGNTAGDIKISGECWLESLTYDASVDSVVPFQAQFRLDGIVTVGTFS